MIAPALAVLFRHWGQKPLMLITLLQIALLLQIGGARSSLTLIFLSVFIRLSKNSKIGVKSNRIKEIATISIVIYFILIVIQAIPVLREEIRNERISPSTYVGILRDPLTNLTSVSGFDSVQGAILAINAKIADLKCHLSTRSKHFPPLFQDKSGPTNRYSSDLN